MMIMGDYDGQMIFGDLGGLKLPDICLTGEEKPRKNSARKLVPTGDRTRARCVTGAHANAWPTGLPVKYEDFTADISIREIERVFYDRIILEGIYGLLVLPTWPPAISISGVDGKMLCTMHRFETAQFELALIWSFSPKNNVRKYCKRACLLYDLLRRRDFSLLIVR